ncbi:MAG: ribosomal-processing cysteine protease Prp [Acutalibacteraceae bacterium]|nr:ribosomal-processing cysteine protease Prp [Acutalibacteraceae bacterium]
MTSVKFLSDKENLYGFEIKGHSSFDCDDIEGKIVCSAVSSAAYMAANTVTEIIGDECKAVVDDALMRIEVKNPSSSTVTVLKGLKLQLNELSKQYGNRIKITTEV